MYIRRDARIVPFPGDVRSRAAVGRQSGGSRAADVLLTTSDNEE